MNAHVSRWFRRAVFGFLALSACLGFAAFAGILLCVQPAGVGQQVVRQVLIHSLTIGAVFMLLAGLGSFSCASRWVTPLIDRLAPKASFIILALAISICAFAIVDMAFG